MSSDDMCLWEINEYVKADVDGCCLDYLYFLSW